MEDTIFNFTRLFSNYKSVFHYDFTNHDETYERSCNTFISQNTIVGSSFKSHCKKCMKYLKYLEDENPNTKENSMLNIAQSLLYLYFWINDNELDTTNYYEISLDTYKKLLNSFDEKEDANMRSTYIYHIKDDIIEKLKLIYNLYYKFDKLTQGKTCQGTNCKCAEECVNLYTQGINDCDRDVNAYYCNELEKFRQIYHTYMNDKVTCDEKYKYLPSATKSNIAVISVSIVITLTTLILLLYKFTPLGSYLRTRMRTKKKNSYNLEKKIHHISHPSELSHSNSKNMYNVTYHSMEHT